MEVLNDYGDSNSMMSQMDDVNSAIKQHNKDIVDRWNATVSTAQTTASALRIQHYATHGVQLGLDMKKASSLASSVGGWKNMAMSGGRTGGETTLGAKPAIQAVKKVLGTTAAAPSQGITTRTGEFVPGKAAPSVEWTGDTPEQPTRSVASAADEGRPSLGRPGTAPAEAPSSAAPTEGEPVTQTRPSGKAPQEGSSGAEEAGAEGAEEEAGKLGKVGTLAEGAGRALGVAGGITALGQDIFGEANGSKHFLAGDNTAERVGNGLQIASGALDAISVAIPVFAPVAALFGLASAVSSAVGDEEDAKTTADAPGKAPKGQESTHSVSTLASVGAITNAGTDTLHSIGGASAAY